MSKDVHAARFLCLLALPLSFLVSSLAPADEGTPRRRYDTRAVPFGAIALDGRIVESAWDQVEWSGEYVQHSPDEGSPPSERTQFKILYDPEALYVAFRCWDQEPAKIGRLLARRDWFPGDWVEINIDSRGDHRTAFSFTTSVSGSRGDEYISDDGDRWDSNWDPVWSAKTQIDSLGWTAEVRIPFNQLRYDEREEQVWGIQSTRRIFRHDERSVWQRIPRDAPAWVSLFGELHGIRGIRAPRRIELLPYAVGSLERFEKVPGNPFRKGHSESADVGLDGKLGLTGNMVLDFTANPDFGQVEADPSEVNLTAFETFFEEKRPFFIEGSETFRYRLSEAITGGSFTSDRLFYSRRIGRAPRGFPEVGPDEAVDLPGETRILGAGKLSGKTASGFSVGALDAVTAEERAEIRGPDGKRTEVVEPRTNYFVGRAQQSFHDGRTLLGGMLTTTHRDDAGPVRDLLHSGAFTGGVDLEQRWHQRDYYLQAKFQASEVRGSREAILLTQTASARYFQRPDADYVKVDSTRTSLRGTAGSIYQGKNNGHWRYQTGVTWRSPGFEVNDLGYLRSADEVQESSWLSYQIKDPFAAWNEFTVNANQWLGWDFGGRNILRQVNLNSWQSFRNHWSFNVSSTRTWERRSNTALRGGPSLRLPAAWELSGSLESDTRRPYGSELSGAYSWNLDGDTRYASVECELRWRPTSQAQVEVVPRYDDDRDELQYLYRLPFGTSDRYVFGTLRQKTASATVRIDGCITPNLSVQYYGQPFLSSGRTTEIKRIARPGAERYADRFHVFSEATGEIRYDAADARYEVDEDGGGTDYSFDDPDFNYKAFQSTAVVRWEYLPGSTVFLVWTQSREGSVLTPNLEIGRDLDRLFDLPPHNVWLIKVSRWLSW